MYRLLAFFYKTIISSTLIPCLKKPFSGLLLQSRILKHKVETAVKLYSCSLLCIVNTANSIRKLVFKETMALKRERAKARGFYYSRSSKMTLTWQTFPNMIPTLKFE